MLTIKDWINQKTTSDNNTERVDKMIAHLYICDKRDISDDDINKVLYLTGKNIFKPYRIDKIKKNRDKKLALATAIVEREAVRCYCDYDQISINITDNGKPVIENCDKEPVYYNVSHSKDYAVAIALNENVGVDIQSVSVMNKSVMAKLFCKDEIDRVIMAPNQDEEFTRLWANNESIKKYTGEGIFKKTEQVTHINI